MDKHNYCGETLIYTNEDDNKINCICKSCNSVIENIKLIWTDGHIYMCHNCGSEIFKLVVTYPNQTYDKLRKFKCCVTKWERFIDDN